MHWMKICEEWSDSTNLSNVTEYTVQQSVKRCETPPY